MTEDDDLNNVRYKAKYRYETKQPLTEEQWVKDLNARIKVLEKALVKADEDYEQVRLDYWRLFDENKRLLDEISIKEDK